MLQNQKSKELLVYTSNNWKKLPKKEELDGFWLGFVFFFNCYFDIGWVVGGGFFCCSCFGFCFFRIFFEEVVVWFSFKYNPSYRARIKPRNKLQHCTNSCRKWLSYPYTHKDPDFKAFAGQNNLFCHSWRGSWRQGQKLFLNSNVQTRR